MTTLRSRLDVLQPAAEEPAAASPPKGPAALRALLGRSRPMDQVRVLLGRLATLPDPVLIRGEAGTGKTLAARVLHAAGSWPGPLERLEGAVIGAEALTERLDDACRQAPGYALLVEEVGELAPPAQQALVRLLAVSSRGEGPRILATTRRALEAQARTGRLLPELLEALAPRTAWMPPLRVRPGDVELLAEHFVGEVAAAEGLGTPRLEPAALELLAAQRWPGNASQLRAFVERLVLLGRGRVLTESDVRRELASVVRFALDATTRTRRGLALLRGGAPPEDAEARSLERRALGRVLEHARGHEGVAARVIGLALADLRSRLAAHGLR